MATSSATGVVRDCRSTSSWSSVTPRGLTVFVVILHTVRSGARGEVCNLLGLSFCN